MQDCVWQGVSAATEYVLPVANLLLFGRVTLLILRFPNVRSVDML